MEELGKWNLCFRKYVCSWLAGMSVAVLESEKMPVYYSYQNYKHIVPKPRRHCVLANILVTKTEKCYSVYILVQK